MHGVFQGQVAGGRGASGGEVLHCMRDGVSCWHGTKENVEQHSYKQVPAVLEDAENILSGVLSSWSQPVEFGQAARRTERSTGVI